MVKPTWRDELHAALIRERLPPAYVARLADELCAHYDDLLEETSGMDAEFPAAERLGAPDELAAAAAVAFRRRSFSHQHPLAMYACGPVGLVMLSWFMLAVAHFAIGSIIGDIDMNVSLWEAQILSTIATLELLLPIVLLTVWFVRWVERQGQDRRWALLATGMLALMAGLCFSTASLSPETHRPMLNLIAGVPYRSQQWLQSAVVFAIGAACCLWRRRRPGALTESIPLRAAA
jgi:hypothetical protein